MPDRDASQRCNYCGRNLSMRNESVYCWEHKNQSSNMSVIITNANLLFINVLYTNTPFYVVTKLNIPIFSHNSLFNSAERHFIGVFIPGWDMLMVRQQLCLCATCMCWHLFDVNYSYTSNLCMTTARIHNHCKCTN